MRLAALVLGAHFLVSTVEVAIGAPGDAIRTVLLPIPGSGSSRNQASVATDCMGNVYFSQEENAELYTMDRNGRLLFTVPTTDSISGLPITIDEMAWDEGRSVLWGARSGGWVSPTGETAIYTVDPATGVATHVFDNTGNNDIDCWRNWQKDGLGYDTADDTLWVSEGRCHNIEHYRVDGTFLGRITPREFFPPLDHIGGVVPGLRDQLYVAMVPVGDYRIARVKKSDGDFIDSFEAVGVTALGGLACDPINFAPKLALWLRYPDYMDVVEIEPGTCSCGRPPSCAALAAGGPSVCRGQLVTLDGSGSTSCSAAGLQYRWLDGATVLCDWSPGPTCDVRPTSDTTYTLEISCLDRPDCADTDVVTVTVAPSPTPHLAPVEPICEGESITLDASGSIPDGCTPLEYQFEEGATILRPFDRNARFVTSPPGTTLYSVRVRCSADPTCETTTSLVAEVLPDLVPRDIGNTIRAIRWESNVAMSWVTVPNARTYNLYRGTAKGIWPPALLTGLSATTESLPDVPTPPRLYYYRVAGASCSGREGP